MFSRLALVFALLLPVPALAQFQPDIDRWTAQDALDAPPTGALLFVGSSSIRRWEAMTRVFADYEVIQRGFGGAEIDDVVVYRNDIVINYAPAAIVLYAGTNDIAAGDSGTLVHATFVQFVNGVQAALPNTDIFFIGIYPTPGRFANAPEEMVANNLIEATCNTDPHLHYIDTPGAFYALNPPSDPAFTSLFVDDIHLNPAGYDLWRTIIRPQVEAVLAPNKSSLVAGNALQAGRSLLFDPGPSNTQDGDPTSNPDALGNHWNNWHPAEGGVTINAGEHLGNLVDNAGAAIDGEIVITGGFNSNGKLNGGLLAPDPNLLGNIAIGTATQDYFFSTADGLFGGPSDDTPGGVMFRDLDPNLAYTLEILGSRNTTAARSSEYRVFGAGESVYTLQTSGNNIGSDGSYDGNDDELAVFEAIRTDAFGQLFVDITLVQGDFAYINAAQLIALLPGDANGDCLLDESDALAQINDLSGPENATTSPITDIDGDRDTDMRDFVELLDRIGRTCP